MKSIKRIRIIILFVIMAFFLPVILTETALSDQTACRNYNLSLQSAIESALEKNPLLEAAQHRVAASAERITQAKSGFYPKVYISEAYQLTTNPMWAFGMKLNQGIITQQDFDPDSLNDPSSIDNFNTMLWMTWPLFDSGQTWYGQQQAEFSHQASAAGLDRSCQEIISQTVAAYTDLVFAKESVSVVNQALQTAEAQLRLIEDRYKSGLTVKSDLLRVRVHISELEQQRVDANSRYLIAQAALNAVMGKEMSDDVLPTTPLFKSNVPAKELKDWINEALSNRPDLKQINLHEQTARTEIKKSRSAHWPSVNINGSYEMNTADFDDTANSYTVGANVTMNLFSGFGISAREREALYRQNEINANLRAMNQKIRLETREAYYKLQSAEKRIQVAELSVDAAIEALRIVSSRYKNGQLSIVSLLDAELTLTRARNNLNMALKDHIQYRVQLALAVGTLGSSFQ
ncbi:MAG: TolC family protein [Desulfobacteraceae bacterium]|nr:TolC family protein [Desulfobacteraceae bacterium]MBC2756616.1 TolC family protein [Desulfobacteraceae bacterium]